MKRRRNQLLALMLSAAMCAPSFVAAVPVYGGEIQDEVVSNVDDATDEVVQVIDESLVEETVIEDAVLTDETVVDEVIDYGVADANQEILIEDEDTILEEDGEDDLWAIDEEADEADEEDAQDLLYADDLIEDEETTEDDEDSAAFVFEENNISNTTGMFKVVSASYDGENLTFALSGKGYRELFVGTYEEAVANGNNTDNWVHGVLNADSKYEFTIKLTDGVSYYPIVAISNSYYNKYLEGTNTLQRAFYPRQIEVDLTNKTLVAGDYNHTETYTVINNVKMFSPSSEATLTTVGGPNSNNYAVTMTLPMNSTSNDYLYVGSVAQANEADLGNCVALVVDSADATKGSFTFQPAYFVTVGNPSSILDTDDVYICFHSARNSSWYERKMTIDTSTKTVTFNSSNADYTAVNAALAKIPEDLTAYTTETADAVTQAKNAVVTGKFASEQESVDAMATALETAIAGLISNADVETLAELKEKISALPSTADTTEEDRSAIEEAQTLYESLGEAAKAELDKDSPSGSSQPYSRVLESAVWGLAVLQTVDNSTTLPAGTYTSETTPSLSSSSNTGKSTSSRGRTWTWISVTVDENGKATGVLSVNSGTMTSIRLNGQEYAVSSVARTGSTFENIPVDLNGTMYLAGKSSSMGTEIAYAITNTIDEPAPADFSTVDAAKTSVPTDLSNYTDESVAAVTAALNAVVRDRSNITQEEVDAMAKAIQDAVAALVEKQTETEKQTEAETETETKTTTTTTTSTTTVAVGTTVNISSLQYKVTSSKTVTFTGTTKKSAKSVTIPATVKIKGKSYKVTEIKSSAFKNNTKLTKVTIGKYVTTIGNNAFYGCKALTKVTVKSSKITSIGKNAFKKAGSSNYSNLKVTVPTKKLSSYKKLLKKAKLSSKAKVTK